MGIKWFTETMDWDAIGRSINTYLNLNPDEYCMIVFLDPLEPWGFHYSDMRVGDGEGNYYD